MRIYNECNALERPVGRILDHGYCTQGEVLTPHGIVVVCPVPSEYDPSFHTRLDFVYEGKYYVRCFEKKYTSRGCVKKANEFVKQVVGI